MKIITHERCVDYEYAGHPERPARIRRTWERLRAQQALPLEWVDPLPVDEALLAKAHSSAHLKRLEAHVDFDMDTPAYADIAQHARRSVGAGLHAMRSALKKEKAFSLIRPPGHHATREKAMGFCYLNNIALAALAARAEGVGKIAIFDFDVHHGNGTEDILVDQDGFLFISIHQYPAYPGTGRHPRGKNCLNYVVPPGYARLDYRDVASRALEKLQAYQPELVAVSAGFDAYARDPLCQQQLEPEDFCWYGATLRQLGFPTFSLLEGGYSDDLPELILAYLRGLQGMPLQEDWQEASAKPPEPPKPEPDLEPFWGPSF